MKSIAIDTDFKSSKTIYILTKPEFRPPNSIF